MGTDLPFKGNAVSNYHNRSDGHKYNTQQGRHPLLSIYHKGNNEVKDGDEHERHQPILPVFHMQILNHLGDFEHDYR